MSRSNPDKGRKPQHVCDRWLEWAGGSDGGYLKYYDRETKETIRVPLPFTMLVLDVTSTVTGWHDASESKVYSNEVRDMRERLDVRSFKGGDLASGTWKEIKDTTKAAGGKFTSNVYCAIKDGDGMRLACLQLSGAALMGWLEFRKAAGDAVLNEAVTITGFEEGKKGSVKYRTPVFSLKKVSEATNEAAREIDRKLQAYLDSVMGGEARRYEEEERTGEAARDSDKDDTSEDDIPF